MMQYPLFAIVAGAIVLAGGACRGGVEPVWCIPGPAVRAPPDQGINPLMPNPPPRCFSSARDCMESQDGSSAPAACVKIARPAWHCYTMTADGSSSDPLDGAAMCYPSAALCAATRPASLMEGSHLTVGPCTAAATVVCHTHDRAQVCSGTTEQCELRRSLTTDVVKAQLELGPCVERRSAD